MAVEWWCLKTASTNVSSKCSQKAWARATPDSALVGMLNIETIFPYFFSSTPGPLPSISFSHHANWQKLVPFALFIYLAETACSLDATTSQNSNWRFFMLVYSTSVHFGGNWTMRKCETRLKEAWFDLLMHIYELNGSNCKGRVERNTTSETGFK